MIKHKVGEKISLQLLAAISISLFVSLGAILIMQPIMNRYYISNPERFLRPAFVNTYTTLVFVVAIGLFIITFLLLI